MEEDSLKKYKEELAKKSIERLRCNVCLERASKPLLFCRAGHVCCSRCKSKLRECPVCQKAFSEDKNITLEQMLEISIFPCRNEIFGCKIIGEYNNINEHEKYNCNFKRFKCFLTYYDEDNEISQCDKIVTLFNFKEHIKNDHLERKIISEKGELRRDLSIGEGTDFSIVEAIEVVPVDDNLGSSIFFLENLSCEDNVLSVTYHYVGSIEDAKKYKYFFSIKENSTIVTAQNKCLPVTIRDDSLECQKCLKIDISSFDDLNKSEDEVYDKELILFVSFDCTENEIKWDSDDRKRFLGIEEKPDCSLTEEKMIQTDEGESNVEPAENEETDTEEKFFDGVTHVKEEEEVESGDAKKLQIHRTKIFKNVGITQKLISVMLLFVAFFGILLFPYFTGVIVALFIVFILPVCFFKISRMYSKRGGFIYNGYKLF